MGTWVLVMYIYAGAFAKGDSVTLYTIPGFSSEAACKAQGPAGERLVLGTSKEYAFVCMKVN